MRMYIYYCVCGHQRVALSAIPHLLTSTWVLETEHSRHQVCVASVLSQNHLLKNIIYFVVCMNVHATVCLCKLKDNLSDLMLYHVGSGY